MVWKKDNEEYKYEYESKKPVKVYKGIGGKIQERVKIAKARDGEKLKGFVSAQAKKAGAGVKGYVKGRMEQRAERKKVYKEEYQKAYIEALKRRGREDVRRKFATKPKRRPVFGSFQEGMKVKPLFVVTSKIPKVKTAKIKLPKEKKTDWLGLDKPLIEPIDFGFGRRKKK